MSIARAIAADVADHERSMRAVNKTPRYVLHDDARWSVSREIPDHIDGAPAYYLKRGNFTLVARVSECIPDDRPRKRRFKDDDFVLEIDSRGNATIREKGRRKRFTTSLAAIYAMTVKQEAMNLKRDKAFKRKRR